MHVLTLYSKPGCHLCDLMKDAVRRAVAVRSGYTLKEVDISTDAALLHRYELEIPVLELDGKKIAKYRIGTAELDRALDARRE